MIFMIFVILIFLFFIPLPMHFQLHIINNSLSFNITNIFSVKIDNFIKYYSTKHSDKFKNKITLKKLHKIIEILKKFHYKPKVFVKLHSEYSLNDAAKTSCFYGLLNAIFSYLNYFICLFYKIKYTSFKIEPVYNDCLSFAVKIRGILLISLAQITIMILITYRIKNIIKRGEPVRDKDVKWAASRKFNEKHYGKPL